MVRRRNAFNLFEPSAVPRWYVVRGQHGGVLKVRQLPARADLPRIFVAALLERIGTDSQMGGKW